LRTLATRLIRAYEIDPEVVRFRMKAGGLLLGVDTAIPCGLIVNELVTNSLKHAFGAAQNGKTREIEIDLLPEEGHRVTLLVRDNGVGLPEGAEFESFGLGLVKAMAEQLGGTISVSRGNGTEFRLSFAVPSD
jgi:two-component sensor histidine kinase